ncbi:MAG: DUF3788 family protein [Ignavibacteria bacterium]|nr:DUF3788 family protein [Ignavibacteria bacterium]
MPPDAFANEKKHPSDNDLRKCLGRSYKLFEETIMRLQFEQEGIHFEWKFSKTSGWYLICLKKKRRLFYLLPRHRDFSFRMVFGDKAIEQIKKGRFPKFVIGMIRDAKKYPEGTLYEFDKKNFHVETMLGLLRIKIEN